MTMTATRRPAAVATRLSTRAGALAYARANRPRFLAALCDFIRIPSVSSQPERAGAVRRCAGWLAGHMRRIGLDEVEVIATAGHPVVVGG
jgi:acetylornithine deacetylase/succinyl-diaminopimelate desuccinylase-like protein